MLGVNRRLPELLHWYSPLSSFAPVIGIALIGVSNPGDQWPMVEPFSINYRVSLGFVVRGCYARSVGILQYIMSDGGTFGTAHRLRFDIYTFAMASLH
jgi:hypothetical protein